MPKYGRSLSFCIKNIIDGKVNINDVEMFVTSTCIHNNNEFEKVMKHYADFYWYKNPEKAVEIAWQFWNSGKIIQPRLLNNNATQNISVYPIWANSLKEAMDSVFIKDY
ncbi:MAG: hypothetical protein WC688_07365 [Parachlamydiales bacterium]|jgi:hypothetical protein